MSYLSNFALPSGLRSPPRSPGQRLATGMTYAAEAAICAALLMTGYAWTDSPGVSSAVISAIVVLQPGIQQSIQTLALRIVANLIGASTGFFIGWWLGVGNWHVIGAIVVVAIVCEMLRLEQSLRSACVSVVIVMTAVGGNLATTSRGRLIAVALGSIVAVIVQLLVEALLRRMLSFWRPLQTASPGRAADD